MTDPLEIWLRTVCFQKPTDPAYDLARDAWKAAIAHERAECAKVCDARYMGDNNREDAEAKRCAAAIRARSEP